MTTYLLSDGTAAAVPVGGQTWLYTSAVGQTLIGTVGNTVFNVGHANTTVVEQAGQGIDTVLSYTGFTLPDNVENLTIRASQVTGIGNSASNTLIAEGANVTLRGGPGADVLVDNGTGSSVFDIRAGSGNDVIYGFKTAKAAGAQHDAVRLGGYGISDFSQLQSKMTQVGADVRIAMSVTDSVVLRSTNLADLGASDFLLSIDTGKMKLTFDDEFNGLSLYNRSTGLGVWKTNYQWNAQTGSSSWQSRTLTLNHEKEIYVDPSYAGSGTTPLGINPFSISNGELTIHAAKTPTSALSALNNYQYTSGLLTTEKSFSQTYGYFEMRAQLPTGQGLWPAFWLVPADGSWPPELDVVETSGGNRIYHTTHTGETGSVTTLSFASDLASLGGGYHNYGVLWTAQKIEYYIDGVAVASTATPSDMNKPMYMLVNLAIGGDFTGTVPATFTGADLKVDYIRAYSLESPVTTSITSAVTTTLSSGALNLLLTGTLAISGSGNSSANLLTGNGAANSLFGMAGNDTLDGGLGNDTLTGGAGADIFHFQPGTGDDVVTDFAAGGDADLIDISAYLNAGQKPTLTNTGNDVSIGFANGDSILLKNIQSQSLVATSTGYKMGIRFFSESGGEQTSHSAPMWQHTWGALETAGDKDWFKIDLVQGANMKIAVEAGGSGMGALANAKVSIYDSAGALIASDDDGGSGADAVAKFTAPATACYYIVVESGAAGGTGGYMIDATSMSMVFDAGAHLLGGTAANDILVGSMFDDSFTGGAGADRFQIGFHAGHDVITDFKTAGDLIDIMAYTSAGHSPTVAPSGSDTIISFDTGDTIRLLGVNPGELVENYWGFSHI